MLNCSLYEDVAEICRFRNCPEKNRHIVDQVTSAKENGKLPEMAELVQFGKAVNLNFFRTVALVLKGERERSVKLDTNRIYALFESENQWASRFGFSRELFHTLIREMTLAQLHLIANNSVEIKSFSDRAKKQHQLISKVSPESERMFREAKLSWLWLQEDLGEKLILIESRRLRNAYIQKEWMHLFGSAYISLREQTLRLEFLELKNQFIEGDPDISLQNLDDMLQHICSAMKKEVDELGIELTLAGYSMYSQTSHVIDRTELDRYITQNKKMLREIWMLIHPDRLAQHPSFEKLTQDQKHYIKELWNQAFRVRPDELRFQEDQIGYELRSDLVLLDILRKAESILQYAGIDTDTDLIISGETTEEQLAWLEKAIVRLSRDINNAIAELKALMENQDILEKEVLLKSETEQQKKFRDEMLKKAAELKKKADVFEKKIEVYFSRVSPCN
jgi:hypothetical protein